MKIKKRNMIIFFFGSVIVLFVIYMLVGSVDVFLWQPWRAKHIDPRRSVENTIHSLGIAISMYRKDFGEYPPTGNENLVKGLLSKTKKGPYVTFFPKDLINNQIIDKWGTPLIYIQPGKYSSKTYDMYSCGPNRRDDKGKKDDIGNW